MRQKASSFENEDVDVKFDVKKLHLLVEPQLILTEDPEAVIEEEMDDQTTNHHLPTTTNHHLSPSSSGNGDQTLHSDNALITNSDLSPVRRRGDSERSSQGDNREMEDIRSWNTQRCPVCNHWIQLSNMKAHMKLHTEERKFPCTYCEMKFKDNTTLRQHVRRHTGERPYKCSYCEKAFKQQSQVNQHTRLHTGERPYTCTYCEKTFIQKNHLDRHIRTHTGEKPYNCSHCDQSYIDRSSLNHHLKQHVVGTGIKRHRSASDDDLSLPRDDFEGGRSSHRLPSSVALLPHHPMAPPWLRRNGGIEIPPMKTEPRSPSPTGSHFMASWTSRDHEKSMTSQLDYPTIKMTSSPPPATTGQQIYRTSDSSSTAPSNIDEHFIAQRSSDQSVKSPVPPQSGSSLSYPSSKSPLPTQSGSSSLVCPPLSTRSSIDLSRNTSTPLFHHHPSYVHPRYDQLVEQIHKSYLAVDPTTKLQSPTPQLSSLGGSSIGGQNFFNPSSDNCSSSMKNFLPPSGFFVEGSTGSNPFRCGTGGSSNDNKL